MAVQQGQEQLTAGSSDQTGRIRFFVCRVPAQLWNEKSDQGTLSERLKAIKKLGQTSQNGNTEKHFLLYDEAHPEEDLAFAVPGGIIGAHAFFTILENILRNAAKYSYQKENGDLYIVIEILDPQNSPPMWIRNPGSETRIPAVLVRIYDNVSHNVDIQKINEKLRKPLLDEATFDTRREAWGLAEIAIAAGFLQQRDILHIGLGGDGVIGDLGKSLFDMGREGAEAIVRAVKSPICTLGYEFFMLKPLELEVILPEGETVQNLEQFFKNFPQVFVVTDPSQVLRRGDLFLWFVSGTLRDSRSRFLRVLGAWLKKNGNSLGEGDWREIWKDLRSWFGETQEKENDREEALRKWLSVVIERFPRRFFLALPESEYPNGLPWLDQKEDPLIRRIVWMVYALQGNQLVLKDAKHREIQFALTLQGGNSGGAQTQSRIENLEKFLRFLRARFVDRLLPPVRKENRKSNPLFEIDWHYALVDPSSQSEKRLNRYDVETLPLALRDSAEARTRKQNGNGEESGVADRVIMNVTGEKISGKPASPARLLVVCSRHDAVKEDTVKYTERLTQIKDSIKAWRNSGNTVEGPPRVVNFVLTGAFPWFALIQHDTSSLPFRVAEAGAVRVGVMDERFQEWNQDEKVWRKNAVAGVFSVYLEKPGQYNQPGGSPEPYWTLHLDESSLSFVFHPENQTPQQALSALTDLPHVGKDLNVKVPFDILIVHMGLLETAFPEKGREFFEALVYQLKEKIPFVVFTSGRGEPEKLPEGVGFLPLASFMQTFHSVGVDKVSLVRTVFALTRTGGAER